MRSSTRDLGQVEPSLGRDTGAAVEELLEQRERELLQRHCRGGEVLATDVQHPRSHQRSPIARLTRAEGAHGSTRRARIAAR